MPENTITPSPPKLVLLAITLASAAALIGALAAGWVALFAIEQTLWASLGFAAVAAISAVIGVLAGIGRFNRGLGMAALCVGGAIAVSAGFSYIDLGPNLGDAPQLARALKPWAAMQAVAAAVVVASGGLAVLSRSRASWKSVAVGIAFLIPAAVVLAGIAFGMDRIPDGESGRVLSLGLLLIGGTAAAVLFSLGGHHLIRAFEMTADEPGTNGA